MAWEAQVDAGRLGKDERWLCDPQQIPCPLWASTSLFAKGGGSIGFWCEHPSPIILRGLKGTS